MQVIFNGLRQVGNLTLLREKCSVIWQIADSQIEQYKMFNLTSLASDIENKYLSMLVYGKRKSVTLSKSYLVDFMILENNEILHK